ncbi:bifunctional hydroxymethylpyrimidine kinase/phosphomethylpyrimidine kinase [Ulvibacterium sp.]|uniref:bifunctional hydroxymethylpyrimidine kinase/phosphomethylpyrimidine kinase n=1 Tax=Ulvibacterium sp. TaxID=2665914 RepID=UPI003BA94CBD
MKLPKVLSVSGFDPSAGAGILADIKAFQKHQVYGFGVITGVTFQNESHIKDVRWTSQQDLENQLDLLFKKHTIAAVKIGVTKDAEMLQWAIAYLRGRNPNVIIVWDPVFSSSSGFSFWGNSQMNIPNTILDQLDLITPNLDEYHVIWGKDGVGHTDCKAAVLLKTANGDDTTVLDKLFYEGKLDALRTRKHKGYDKHGTGCILSSGITAGLAKGLKLVQAYHKAKNVLNRYMLSSRSLLGHMDQ